MQPNRQGRMQTAVPTKILIIEDNPIDREVYKRYLWESTASGFEFAEADNASIGYFNDKNIGLQLRTIASQIDELRRQLTSVSFLQSEAPLVTRELVVPMVPGPGGFCTPMLRHSGITLERCSH